MRGRAYELGNALIMGQKARMCRGYLVHLHHLSAPERVTLGGRVVQAMTLLELHSRRIIAERALTPDRDTPLQQAQRDERAGTIGAAILVTEEA
jgi:predicted NBD/HSP70 family sugar kinase